MPIEGTTIGGDCMNTYDQTTDAPRNLYDDRGTSSPTRRRRELEEPGMEPCTRPLRQDEMPCTAEPRFVRPPIEPYPYVCTPPMSRDEALTKAATWLRTELGPGFYNMGDILQLAYYYQGL